MRLRALKHLALLALLFIWAAPASAQLIHDMTDTEVKLGTPRVERVGKAAQTTVASVQVDRAFTGVALHAYTEGDATPTGAVRFAEETGWGPWLDLYVVPSATSGSFLAAYRSEQVRQGTPFELRLETPDGARIHLVEAGVFDNRLDADRQPAPEKANTPAGKQVSDHIFPPALINRAAWGAEPFRGTPSNLARPDYRRMTFHHAAGFGAVSREEGIRQVKAIQDFHQNGRGWSDIGYQFVMDQSGRIYQGRPFMDGSVRLEQVPVLAMGAHVGGANTGNIGVSVLGCYHPPETAYECTDVLSPQAIDSLVTMFTFLSDAYGVEPADLLGHRDQGSTSCPGDNNYALLPDMRGAIAELLLTGNQPLGQATLAAQVDEDGVVQIDFAFLVNDGLTRYRLERTQNGITEVVRESSSIGDGTVADAGVLAPGPVVYELYGLNDAGRVQRLAFVEVLVDPPTTYVLTENYPNPFSDATTIRYFLRDEGFVTLRVYDATGREVATLVNEFQEGERWYRADLDASGLASGTYYYQLQVDGFSSTVVDETRQLVLIR